MSQSAFGKPNPRVACFSALAFFALLVCAQQTASAAILDPLSFGSLGTLNLGAGVYTVDTTGAPTLRDAGNNILFTGTTFNQGVPNDALYGGFDPEIAVFTFDSIFIDEGVTISTFGDRPLALLSQSTFTMNSSTVNPTIIDARGQDGDNTIGTVTSPPNTGLGGAGGPGGGKGGDGRPTAEVFGEGPGGGFTGTNGLGTRGNGAGFGGFGGGGFGGTVTTSSYGDLKEYLQGGSGGGGTGTDVFSTKGAGGGGGGGAVEIGAVDSITLHGTIDASGGGPGGGGTTLAGGGSGGGIILHAPTIDGDADILARGGGPVGGPGGGGGGRILALTADGSQPANMTFDANDISVPVGPTPGIIEFGVLPLPADNLVARFTTGSPVSLSQTFTTTLDSNSSPFNLFDLTFDYLFGTTTGSLDIFLDAILLDTITAPGSLSSMPTTHSIQVDGSGFPGSSHTLMFIFDGPTGSIVDIDNVRFPGLANGTFQAGILSPWNATGPGSLALVSSGTSTPTPTVVPEPSSLALLMTGITGLLAIGYRKRRQRLIDTRAEDT